MTILEYQRDIDEFIELYEKSDILLIPIYKDENHIRSISDVVLLYVYVIEDDSDYVIPFSHCESINQSIDIIDRLHTRGDVWCVNKKLFDPIFHTPTYDVDLMVYLMTNSKLDKNNSITPAHEFFKRGRKVKNIGHIIPISKHTEYCMNLRNKFLSFFDDFEMDDVFVNYNDVILDSLAHIQFNGLYVNGHKLRLFNKSIPIYDNTIFGEYNIFTQTGRPSNSKHSLNFAGLNKKTGIRGTIVSRHGINGTLVQFDFDSYHHRLIANLIDYTFPEESNVHRYLGKFYFGKDDLSDEEYEKSKTVSFRQLYGGVEHKYKDIPYFKLTSLYIEELWDQFRKNRVVYTPLFKRPLHMNFYPDITKNTLFNYILQAYETERNMLLLHELIPMYKKAHSKLVLYTYDSILIDFNSLDGAQIIHDTKRILESGGFPVTTTHGKNYQDMKPIKI